MPDHVNDVIKALNLIPHEEGGFYKEIYRSPDEVIATHHRYDNASRVAGSSIYYLLPGYDFSAWHRVQSDELWHFCSGSSVTLLIFDENKQLIKIKVGNQLTDKNAVYQYTVRQGLWFCAVPDDVNSFSLVSCIVFPGFDYQDWELADKNELLKLYPQHEDIISKYSARG